MFTFPGLEDLSKLKKWYDNYLTPINEIISQIWAFFNTLSTIVTIIGIYKILKTMQQLKKNNPMLKTNYF